MTELPKFRSKKTTLQVRRGYDEDAKLFFVEIRKCGQPCVTPRSANEGETAGSADEGDVTRKCCREVPDEGVTT